PLTGARQKQPVRLALQNQRDAGQLLRGDVLQPCGDVFDEPGRNLVSQLGVPSLPACQRPSPPFFQFSKAWALSPTAASGGKPPWEEDRCPTSKRTRYHIPQRRGEAWRHLD